MIQFSCRCGHVFEEPDDSVGQGVQCPRCHLLNDVPRISDLPAIAGDGTYKVDSHHARTAPDNLDDTLLLFSNTKLDAEGQEIDLRSLEQVPQDEIGAYDTIESLKRAGRPRYDPETGELITPVPVAPPAIPQPAIPIASRHIAYEHSDRRHRSMAYILLELTQPLNMFVMFFVFCLHVAIYGIVCATLMGFFMIAPLFVPLFVAIVAHYGNLVDEIGVEEQNELPRMLRDLRFHEDIWNPFVAIVAAFILCFGPAAGVALVALDAGPLPMIIALFLGVVGVCLFPAVVLTLLCSGAIANLRPDRVAGVIGRLGRHYVTLVATLVLATVPYLFSLGVLSFYSLDFVRRAPSLPTKMMTFNRVSLALPMLAVAIYAMHAFCYKLGLVYRVEHSRFPWVGRVHVGAPRPPVVRRKPRYVTPRVE